ncbi:LacI family transcriptional regulator [Rhizobium rhizosphaerae]|uniref:LacI family transcriptional regulator n=1 Tax=Xaviernesmea rhizosphaerae TaxID=1672749 RepID=A0ABX3PFE6_9HYPH|nr:XRE family transcriptional regulator [Xaviernesmea rhizosphaerae]OQP87200.1 LacI family transcriptional regulator [Xaviernesmea rhizosphaerae]
MTEPQDLDRRIGARIRIERDLRAWSLTDLAERAGVSRAMINKVERGESSPTAQLLGKLSGAFGLSMSTLMARAERGQGRLARRGEQPLWTDPETGYLRRQVSPRTELPLELVEIVLPPRAEVAMPAAAYAFQRQLIWVLEGALIFTEGSLRHELQAGDCLELGPPVDCRFDNETEAPCRYAVMLLKMAG